MQAALSIGGIVLAAVAGYLFRGREFRRDQRLRLYSDFVSTFIDAASAGAGLASAYMVFGDKIGDAGNRDRVRPFWEAWERAAPAFTQAAARLRFVASDRLRARAEELEDFLDNNIRAAPPLNPAVETNRWGEAIKVGPARVAEDSIKLARSFAEDARPEVGRAW